MHSRKMRSKPAMYYCVSHIPEQKKYPLILIKNNNAYIHIHLTTLNSDIQKLLQDFNTHINLLYSHKKTLFTNLYKY